MKRDLKEVLHEQDISISGKYLALAIKYMEKEKGIIICGLDDGY